MMSARADLRDLRDDRIHRSLDLHHQQQYSSGLILSTSGNDDSRLSMPLSMNTGGSFRSHGYSNQPFIGTTPTKRVRFEDDSSIGLTSPFMPDSPSLDNDIGITQADSVSYDSASDEESHPTVVST